MHCDVSATFRCVFNSKSDGMECKTRHSILYIPSGNLKKSFVYVNRIKKTVLLAP